MPKPLKKCYVENGIGVIPLSRGRVAHVSRCDLTRLAQFNWHLHSCGENGLKYYASRTTYDENGRMTGVRLMHHEVKRVPSAHRLDHVDGDGLNNCRRNLRHATCVQNGQNMKKKKGCLSRYKGVTLRGKRWAAYISAHINSVVKPRRLGSFATEEEAARAYDRAALKHFGEVCTP